MAKEYTIAVTHRGRTLKYTGTVEQLRSDVFRYTLECGNSRNYKINRFPKTAKALVKALNQSVAETQVYDRDSFELVH